MRGGTLDGLCDPYADYAGNDGTVVTIVGPIVPVKQQLFEDSWAEFEVHRYRYCLRRR